MRVLDLQRIEGPLHASDAPRKCLTSLLQLELRPEPAVTVVVASRQHMRMQVGLWISVCGILPCLHAWQRHGETHHRFRRPVRRSTRQIGVEGSDDLAANFLTNEKSLARDDVAFVVAPDFDLHLNACFELIVTGAGADKDHGRGSVRGKAAGAEDASLRFAPAQRASSSAGCSSSSGLSEASSISLKRWRKRRLQPRRAISASTPR